MFKLILIKFGIIILCSVLNAQEISVYIANDKLFTTMKREVQEFDNNLAVQFRNFRRGKIKDTYNFKYVDPIDYKKTEIIEPPTYINNPDEDTYYESVELVESIKISKKDGIYNINVSIDKALGWNLSPVIKAVKDTIKQDWRVKESDLNNGKTLVFQKPYKLRVFRSVPSRLRNVETNILEEDGYIVITIKE